MLFRRDIEPGCAYCEWGTREGETEVLCVKRGAVPVGHHCRAFRYDPLKRIPPRPPVPRVGKFRASDFAL